MISWDRDWLSRMSGAYCCRNDLCLTFESDTAELSELLGYSAEEIRTIFHNCLWELLDEQEREKQQIRIARQLSEGDEVELVFPICRKDGSHIWVLNRGHRVIDKDGQEYLHGLLVDITRSKHRYDEQKKTLELYQLILAQTQQENIVFEWDCISDTISFSHTWETIFGYKITNERFSERLTSAEFFHPDDSRRLEEHLQALKEGEANQILDIRLVRSDGNYQWCRVRAIGVYDDDGALRKLVGMITDIDAEKRAARALREQAERDSLTKLYNTHTTRKLAEEYLSESGAGINCALMIIDLDDFWQVNDQHGHMFGDTILMQTAQIIRKQFRSQDIVGRIGGDEFLVLMKDVSDMKLVNKRCSQLVTSLREVFASQLFECRLTCSVGVAFSPMNGSLYSQLFNCADQALYLAKGLGKNQYAFYSREITDSGSDDRENPESSLRLDKGERRAATIAERNGRLQKNMPDSKFLLYVFRQMYEAADAEKAISEMLEAVGRQTDVSHIYLVECDVSENICGTTFEWFNREMTAKEKYGGASNGKKIMLPEACFNEQGVFCCSDISELSDELRSGFEARGIKSALLFAIRDEGVFRGYIGFEECAAGYMWTKEQVNTLQSFSDIVAVFLLKKRMQERAAL